MCARPECSERFPISEDIPILIDDASSTRTTGGCLADLQNPAGTGRYERWKRALGARLPEIAGNVAAQANSDRFRAALPAAAGRRLVLVIGGGTLGNGIENLLKDQSIELVESDVGRGDRTKLVCDAQQLPFGHGTFDAVIIQSVVHLLPDPYRCAREIHRVLVPSGIVYSEAPFLQPGHGGKYDFTRFTLLGHRSLYRDFTELLSGVSSGPGTALAYSVRYFALSFVRSRWGTDLIKGITRITLFWLKYFDYLIAQMPGVVDSAAGTYFLGRRSDVRLSDTELIQQYRGAVKL